jgi:hypothetical protein
MGNQQAFQRGDGVGALTVPELLFVIEGVFSEFLHRQFSQGLGDDLCYRRSITRKNGWMVGWMDARRSLGVVLVLVPVLGWDSKRRVRILMLDVQVQSGQLVRTVIRGLQSDWPASMPDE